MAVVSSHTLSRAELLVPLFARTCGLPLGPGTLPKHRQTRAWHTGGAPSQNHRSASRGLAGPAQVPCARMVTCVPGHGRARVAWEHAREGKQHFSLNIAVRAPGRAEPSRAEPHVTRDVTRAPTPTPPHQHECDASAPPRAHPALALARRARPVVDAAWERMSSDSTGVAAADGAEATGPPQPQPLPSASASPPTIAWPERGLVAELLRLASALDQRDPDLVGSSASREQCRVSLLPSGASSHAVAEQQAASEDDVDQGSSCPAPEKGELPDLGTAMGALRHSVLSTLQHANQLSDRREDWSDQSHIATVPRRPLADTGPDTRRHQREAILHALADRQSRLIHVNEQRAAIQRRNLEQVTGQLERIRGQGRARPSDLHPLDDEQRLADSLDKIQLSTPALSGDSASFKTRASSSSVGEEDESDTSTEATPSSPQRESFSSKQRSRAMELANTNAELKAVTLQLEATRSRQMNLLASQGTELSAAKSHAHELTEQLGKARKLMTEHQERAQAASLAFSKEKKRAANLEMLLGSAEEHQGDLEMQLEAMEERLAVALLDVETAQKDASRRIQEDRNAGARELQALEKKVQEQVSLLETKLFDMTQQLAGTKSAREQLEAARAQLAQAHDERDAARDRAFRAEQQWEETAARAADMEGEARVTQAACAEWQQRATDQERELQLVRQEGREHEEKYTSLLAVHESLVQEHTTILEQVQLLERQKADGDVQIEGLVEEVAAVKTALDATNGKLQETDRSFWDAKEELATAQEEVEELTDQLAGSEARAEEAQARAAALEAKQDALHAELQSCIADLGVAKGRLSFALSAKREAETRVASLEAQPHALIDKWEAAQSTITALTAQLRTLQEEMDRRQAHAETLYVLCLCMWMVARSNRIVVDNKRRRGCICFGSMYGSFRAERKRSTDHIACDPLLFSFSFCTGTAHMMP